MASITNDVIDVLVNLGLVEGKAGGGVVPGLRRTTDASGNTVLAGVGGVEWSKFNGIDPGPYLNLDDVPLQTGNTKVPVYKTYIDPLDGNDAWDGSEPAFTSGTTGPKKTIDTALWTGSKTSRYAKEVLLFRAGTTYIHQSTTAPITITTEQSIGAYWLASDPNAVRPILRSLNNTGSAGAITRCVVEASGTVTDTTISDVVIDIQDVANRNGLVFRQWADSQTLNNITVANVDVIGGTVNHNQWYSGIAFNYPYGYARTTAPAVSKNILVQNCTVTGLGGHGFGVLGVFGEMLANGKWHGIDFVNCVADGNGVYYDSHGFTCYATGVKKLWTYNSWTNVATTVYSRNASVLYGYNIWDIDILYVTAPSLERFQLIRSAVPATTTPAVGEFSFDPATQLLYVNVNANPNTTWTFDSCVYSVKGVRYINCTAKNTQLPGRSGTVEGIGFAMDDYTSHCTALFCSSIDNLGIGYSANNGNGNLFVGCYAQGNGKNAFISLFGNGHKVVNCYFDSTFAVEQAPGFGFGGVAIWPSSIVNFAGFAGATALRNDIVNSTLKWSGADTSVAAIATGNSGSSPLTVLTNNRYIGSGPKVAGRRGYVIGGTNDSDIEPATVLGVGVSAG